MIAVATSFTWLAVEATVVGYSILRAARALTVKDSHEPNQLYAR